MRSIIEYLIGLTHDRRESLVSRPGNIPVWVAGFVIGLVPAPQGASGQSSGEDLIARAIEQYSVGWPQSAEELLAVASLQQLTPRERATAAMYHGIVCYEAGKSLRGADSFVDAIQWDSTVRLHPNVSKSAIREAFVVARRQVQSEPRPPSRILGRCARPELSERALSDLRINAIGELQAKPNSIIPLIVLSWSVGVVPPNLEIAGLEATWVVEPSEGVVLDQHTSTLRVLPSARPGAVYNITAQVEGFERGVPSEVVNRLYIYTVETDPLVGEWTDTTGEIAELIFRPNGTFSVSSTFFEVYSDYWGTYTTTVESGSINLAPTGGNSIPSELDLSGTYILDEHGRLVLRDMFLGQLRPEFVKRWRYVFKRFNSPRHRQ